GQERPPHRLRPALPERAPLQVVEGDLAGEEVERVLGLALEQLAQAFARDVAREQLAHGLPVALVERGGPGTMRAQARGQALEARAGPVSDVHGGPSPARNALSFRACKRARASSVRLSIPCRSSARAACASSAGTGTPCRTCWT